MKNFDVIILCGGKGLRLKPLTNKTPKPLTKIKNRPFLFYLVNFFLKNDCKNIVIACGYKTHLFKKFLNKFFKNKKNIRLVDSGDVDILQRIKDSKSFIENDFFLCYGDAFATLNLKKYIDFYKLKKNSATIVTSYHNLEFGTLKVNKKTKSVIEFKEKPKILEPVNIGYFIFPISFFPYISKYKSWLSFLSFITKKNLLRFFNFNGLHLTFNNMGEVDMAKSKITEVENFLEKF
jgi:glucose-1-phosphate cytidylyltransferase